VVRFRTPLVSRGDLPSPLNLSLGPAASSGSEPDECRQPGAEENLRLVAKALPSASPRHDDRVAVRGYTMCGTTDGIPSQRMRRWSGDSG